MTLRLEKKEKLILFSGLFLIIAVLAFSYLLFILPLKTTVQQKELELENQQKLLEVIGSRDIETTGELAESSVQLQKRVPVKPLLEQFIIDLEMAETLSNSQILQISFTDEGGETITDPSVTQTIPPAENTQTAENPEQSETTPKPEGIKEITLNLSIESESYFDLEKFIETLEQLDRIVEVKSINFAGPAEISSVGTGTEQGKTSFQLTLGIYYFPKLEDLAEELPEIETDGPANKSNPLSDFSDIQTEQDNNNANNE
jgi:type IV pilus assembly protein PilO